MSGYLKENFDKDGKTISFRIGASRGKDEAGKYLYEFRTIKTDSKRVADQKLRELQTEIDKETFIKPGKLTTKDFLKSWLNDEVKTNESHRTFELYSYMSDLHIIPVIGQIPLSQLKPQHLQHLYSEKLDHGRIDGKGGLGSRTVQLIHVTLHKSLEYAVRMGIVIRNVASAVESPQPARHEMKTMNESDMHLFLEQAKIGEYYPLWYTALYTAMRRAELLALQWSGVDLLLCQISVTRSMEYDNDKDTPAGKRIRFKEPKTAKSRRLISLTPSNTIVLRQHREAQEKQRKALNLPAITENDLVFCNYDGTPYLPNSISHAWEKQVTRTGLKGVRLHDARHTHASLLLKQGVHPKIVQERLGHASITATLDTYSHVAPGLQQLAAAKFDEITLPKESKLEKELNYIIQN